MLLGRYGQMSEITNNSSKVLVNPIGHVVRREKVGGAFTLIPQEAKAYIMVWGRGCVGRPNQLTTQNPIAKTCFTILNIFPNCEYVYHRDNMVS